MYAESWPPEIPDDGNFQRITPDTMPESERSIWNYEVIIPQPVTELEEFIKLVKAGWNWEEAMNAYLRESAEAAAFLAEIAWLRS